MHWFSPADIKDTVENVVACDYPAVIRYLSRQAVLAELGIILKKVAPVVRCFAREGQLFGNYVGEACFSRAVVAAEYRDIGKFKLRDASSGEKQERIFRLIHRAEVFRLVVGIDRRRDEEELLLVIGRNAEGFQKNHICILIFG